MRLLMSLAVVLGLSLGSVAQAAFVASGQIGNVNGNDLSIGQVSFFATAGSTVTIDALVWEVSSDLNGDGELTGFDSYLMLFSGTDLLKSADDGGLGSDGSQSSFDSLLTYNISQTGQYMVTIGQAGYSAADALLGFEGNRLYVDYTGQMLGYGDWQLTITGASPVPVPAALPLFASALVALGFIRRKRG